MKAPKPLFFTPTVELFLLSCIALIVLILVGISISQRLLLHMGIRNMRRRRGQAALLICGLTLSSAFITSSFVLNDSIQQASNNQLLRNIGFLDITVTGPFSGEQAASALTTIRQHDHVQAATGLFTGYQTASMTMLQTGFSRDRLNVVAVPPDFDQVFGQESNNTGQHVHFSDLREGEIYLSSTLAQNFPVRAGDRVDLNLSGSHVTVTVRALLDTDIATNGSDIAFANPEQVILPLAFYQHITQQPGVVNTIALRNVHQGADSPQVAAFLQHLFHLQVGQTGKSFAISNQPAFTTIELNIINPDLVYYLGTQAFTNGLGSKSTQFTELAPALSILLVGTGMFLLILLLILLATERRSESGISRALGFTRSHMVGLFLIEGCGYGVIAVIPGILAGIGLVALELKILSFIPLQVGTKTAGTIHIALPIVINGQSLVVSLCLSILTTFVVVLCTALWMSQLTIVAAIRNLPDTREPQAPLGTLFKLAMWLQPTPGQQTRPFQGCAVLWALIQGLFVRGPLCLLLALVVRWLASMSGQHWLDLIGLALLIASIGLLLGWLVRGLLLLLKYTGRSLERRLSLSLIGIGWLVYSLQPGGALFAVFQPPDGLARQAGSGGLSISALEIVQTSVFLVAGAVLLVMANSDMLIALITTLTSHIPPLAPISRTSLAYLPASRFRTMMTVSLLGMNLFLIMLVVTINIGAVQQADVALAAGGFQFIASGRNLPRDWPQQVLTNATLKSDFADIARIESLSRAVTTGSTLPTKPSSSSSTSLEYHWLLQVPGQLPQDLTDLTDTRAVGFSETFFRTTTMPIQARAQGYSSDQAVWNAVLTHPDYAVWRYDPAIHGINPHLNGFHPFTVQMRDGANVTHTLQIIGMVAMNTAWPYLYLSESALTTLYPSATQTTSTFTFLFRLHAGIDGEQARQDLLKQFGSRYTLQLQSLASNATTESLTSLTAFFGCYLVLGLLFGALALGVIMSRAVSERRQHIGMLRALGFSRSLVMGTFALEAGFLITVSWVVGTALALWSAYQLIGSQYASFPVSVPLISTIVFGCYLIAFIAIAFPARKATRISPCEALRYE